MVLHLGSLTKNKTTKMITAKHHAQAITKLWLAELGFYWRNCKMIWCIANTSSMKMKTQQSTRKIISMASASNTIVSTCVEIPLLPLETLCWKGEMSGLLEHFPLRAVGSMTRNNKIQYNSFDFSTYDILLSYNATVATILYYNGGTLIKINFQKIQKKLWKL